MENMMDYQYVTSERVKEMFSKSEIASIIDSAHAGASPMTRWQQYAGGVTVESHELVVVWDPLFQRAGVCLREEEDCLNDLFVFVGISQNSPVTRIF